MGADKKPKMEPWAIPTYQGVGKQNSKDECRSGKRTTGKVKESLGERISGIEIIQNKHQILYIWRNT